MNFTDEQLSGLEVFILTGIINRLVARATEEHFTAHSLPISYYQYGILRALSHEEQTLSELSRKFVLDPSTLVSTVDSLVRKGYVKRSVDPSDRRRAPLSLTDEGGMLLNQVPMPEHDEFSASLKTMGEEKRHQLVALLREVISNMPNGEGVLRDMDARILAHRTNLPDQCK